MQLLQLVGIAFITAIAAILLKGTKPELSLLITVSGGIILLLVGFDMLKGSLTIFHEITALTGIDASFVKILLKMVGIGYLVEFAAGTLTDFGQGALADKLVFVGKIAVLLLAIPILESVLGLIVRLLELIR